MIRKTSRRSVVAFALYVAVIAATGNCNREKNGPLLLDIQRRGGSQFSRLPSCRALIAKRRFAGFGNASCVEDNHSVAVTAIVATVLVLLP